MVVPDEYPIVVKVAPNLPIWRIGDLSIHEYTHALGLRHPFEFPCLLSLEEIKTILNEKRLPPKFHSAAGDRHLPFTSFAPSADKMELTPYKGCLPDFDNTAYIHVKRRIGLNETLKPITLEALQHTIESSDPYEKNVSFILKRDFQSETSTFVSKKTQNWDHVTISGRCGGIMLHDIPNGYKVAVSLAKLDLQEKPHDVVTGIIAPGGFISFAINPRLSNSEAIGYPGIEFSQSHNVMFSYDIEVKIFKGYNGPEKIILGYKDMHIDPGKGQDYYKTFAGNKNVFFLTSIAEPKTLNMSKGGGIIKLKSDQSNFKFSRWNDNLYISESGQNNKPFLCLEQFYTSSTACTLKTKTESFNLRKQQYTKAHAIIDTSFRH